MADRGGRRRDGSQTVVELGLKARVVGIELDLRTEVGGSNEWTFTGRAEVNRSLRDLVNALQSWSSEGEAGEAWFDETTLPDARLRALYATYVAEPPLFAIGSDIDVPLGKGLELTFAFARMSGSRLAGTDVGARYLVGVCSRGPIDLATIAGTSTGIISQLLGNVGLDRLGVYYASGEITGDTDVFGTGEGGQRTFAKGLSFSARFGTSGSYTDLALPPPKAKSTGPSDAGETEPTPPPPSPPAEDKPKSADKAGAPLRFWKDVQKTIGPLQLRRIGGEWHQGKLGILLDTAVELAGLKVGLAGLCVRVAPAKLTKLKFEDLEFGLDGLELDFKRGPVSISGALLRSSEGDQVTYSGMAAIRAASFTIAAIGSYGTTKEKQPSFFIFGAFTGILVGPPCFVVQGLAAGFGYNRALALPDVGEVHKFPLVSLVMGRSTGASTSVLDQLGRSNRFPPTLGQYWLAAGVKFTSFKLIKAFALVTVQFGTRFEIALLGVATLQLPPGLSGRPFVYVELALKVRFAPDDGLLLAMAVLTANSYLFDSRCKLTGGFAFLVWFTPTNPKIENRSGDFVVTLGGYHPKFKIPDHYPRVPRIGFNWLLPECGVAIKGEAYFALTPSFIMAGGRLSVVFRAGDFTAWFEAHADLLIGWEPFHYDGEVGVSIGAGFTMRVGDVTTTLSFELGALLRFWGPPFAGEVYINLGIVAFTVPLGDTSASRVAPKLEWEAFANKFLPRAEDDSSRPSPLSLAIAAGVVSERKGNGRAPGYVIVNPSELRLSVESFIPVTTLRVDKPPKADFTTRLGIRPMELTTLASTLTVGCTIAGSVLPRDGATAPASDKAPMVYQPITKNVPEALWSCDSVPDARHQDALTAKVIPNCLLGVQVMPEDCEKVAEEHVSIDVEPCERVIDRPAPPKFRHADYYDDYSDKTAYGAFAGLRQALANPHVVQARSATIAAMQGAGFEVSEAAIDLRTVGDACDQASVLVAAPWRVRLGELLPLQHGG